jgi:hypothetical protein
MTFADSLPPVVLVVGALYQSDWVWLKDSILVWVELLCCLCHESPFSKILKQSVSSPQRINPEITGFSRCVTALF